LLGERSLANPMTNPTKIEIPVARDFMNDHVLAFHEATDLEKAIRRLVRRGYSGAPVVDADRRVVGVLSEKDCIRALAEAAYERWPEGTVGANATRDGLETVKPDTDIFTIAELFITGNHRRLPVVDNDGVLVGLVSRRDLVTALEAHAHLRHLSTYELIEKQRG